MTVGMATGRDRWLRVTTPLVCGLLCMPLLGLAASDFGRGTAPSELGFRGGKAAATTIGWALVAAILAWGSTAGIVAMRGGWSRFWSCLTLIGVLVPASLWFDAWWLEVGPSTVLGRVAAEAGWVGRLREGVLLLGLLGVMVPMAIWIRIARGPSPHAALQDLDRPRGWARWRTLLVDRWRGLVAGVALLTIFAAGLTVPFDLAQVGSIGFELRALDVRGASPATILIAGWPSMVAGIVGAVLVTAGLPTRRRRESMVRIRRHRHRFGLAAVVLVVGVPAVLLVWRAMGVDFERSLSLHLPAMFGSLTVAGIGAVSGSLVAGCVCGWSLADRGGRRMARCLVFLAVLVALLPATLFAVGMESLWNRSSTAMLYDGPFTLLVGVAARVAVVPALVGWCLAVRLADTPVVLDAPTTLRDFLRATRPAVGRAMIVGGVVGGAVALGEIPVSSRLQPPGFPVLNTALLNAMHYQYVDSVLPAVLVMLGAVALAAGSLVRWSEVSSRPAILRGGSILLCMMVLLPGCDGSDQSNAIPPVSHAVVFGAPGNIDGRFDYPRAIAIDGDRGRIYVVDKSARVQRFDLEGRLETSWRMPAYENGKPTGLNVAPNGDVLVADTHEHRVAIFSPDGILLETHGSLGEGVGSFIYPTDVVAGPDGSWYVSEYGGNDRIQIFDRDWKPIGIIGFAGEEDVDGRPALARPQSMVWDPARDELLIADAVHHRIVVTDAGGRLLRTIGAAGRGEGELSYPYDLALLEDGSLLVVEYGNNRIQRFDPVTGQATGVWGGEGVEPGRLRYPWGLDAAAGTVAVLDSGNSRVIVGDAP